MEPITVKARDGLPLHGYLTRPHGKDDAKNLPLVVFVHGGPYGMRDRWEFDPDVQMLASRGYAVLQVNFRGSGGYGDAFVHAGYREWGGEDAGRRHRRDALGDRAGHRRSRSASASTARSYGGYAALRGATKEPDLYRCAIGYVGVYDLRLMYTRGDIPQSTYGDNYLKMVLGEDEAVLWDRSPLAHVDRLKAKVMLIVGGEDRACRRCRASACTPRSTRRMSSTNGCTSAPKGTASTTRKATDRAHERDRRVPRPNIGSSAAH